MKNPIAESILKQYHETREVISYEPFGGGHINDTFRVKTKHGHYILQRVNKNVFRTNALVNNYKVFLGFLDAWQQKEKARLTPEILRTTSGNYHIIDQEGFAWRLAEFIHGTKSYQISPTPDISFKAAQAMGKFQQFLNTLPAENFEFTIINYHNPESRLQAFKDAVTKAPENLLNNAGAEIEFSLKHQNIVNEYNEIVNKLPKRVTHNDTKLDNMLFYGDEVLVIDLDTVMPSTVLFDYGDMVRTFTSPAAEDEKDKNKISFRTEHFEALTKGYLAGLKGSLQPVEKENLLLGARAIIYEQTLRFLTDYLLGNPYYKVKYPEHNLVRTKTQVALLSAIEQHKNQLHKYVLSL
jgi:N-acetylhexosamine 1-kinase